MCGVRPTVCDGRERGSQASVARMQGVSAACARPQFPRWPRLTPAACMISCLGNTLVRRAISPGCVNATVKVCAEAC